MLSGYNIGIYIHIPLLVAVIIFLGVLKKRKKLPGGTEKFTE
jgi:hypothetical protein